MDSEALGAFGESQLSALASQAQLVSNPVRRDRTGYDSIVEILSFEKGIAADLRPAPLRAFIQVKATKRVGRRSIAIKLSNWQRMISDPSPWFVFVIHVDDHGNAAGAFLIHIDAGWIARAAELLRQTPANELHKHSLSVTYSEANRLEQYHGSALRARVLEAIGSDGWRYEREKRNVFRTCGYDGHSEVLTLTLPPMGEPELARKLQDIWLGKSNVLEYARVKLVDQRFGKPVTVLDSAKPGQVQFMRHPRHGALHVETSDRQDWIALPVEIYSAASTPGAPADAGRFRVKAGPMSIEGSLQAEIEGGTATLSVNVEWNYAEPHPIHLVAAAAKAGRLLAEGRTTMYLTLDRADPASRHRLWMSQVKLDGSQRTELKEIEIAGDLAARVGLGGVELTPDDLCAQYPRFSLLGLVLASELDDLELNVDVDGVDLNGEAALIVTPAAQVSNWIVIASVALFALPLSKDGRVIFRPSRVHVDELWAVRVSELETFDLGGKINALQAYLAQQMPSANIVSPRNRKPLFLEPAFP